MKSVLLLLTCLIGHLFGQECPILTQAQLSNLTDYVGRKYNFPAKPVLNPGDIDKVPGTCFWRVRFTSKTPGISDFSLFLTPDARFLTRELLDTTIDPKSADQQDRLVLNETLGRSDSPSLGATNAKVTINVFSDFQCPYCRQAARVLREIVPNEPGVQLRFHFFPLPNHNWGKLAADAAACAATQSGAAFWSFHDFLFDNQVTLNINNLESKIREHVASDPTMDGAAFRECFETRGAAKSIQADVALGSASDVKSTPTLFVNGFRVAGLSSVEQIRSVIREASAIQDGEPAR